LKAAEKHPSRAATGGAWSRRRRELTPGERRFRDALARVVVKGRESKEARLADVVVKTPMQYLDKATGTLRDLGLLPAKVE
jgi:hypothetical protein